MLIDDLRLQLKPCAANLETIKRFYEQQNIQVQLDKLEATVHDENFWKNPEHVQISQNYKQLKQTATDYQNLHAKRTEIEELIELFESDVDELKNLANELDKLTRDIRSFKISLLLSHEDDNKACFLNINAGAGGTESQDWASMILRMYVRVCERMRMPARVIDYQAADEAGIKSATLHITGKNAYGLLKGESGIHRLVRISPFDSSKRRHTSFAGVAVTKEVEEEAIEIKGDDLRIDTYRASGAGGQHVNTTDSAIRITHIPTGIVVQCQNERSQGQNKQTAMKQLAAKLAERQEEEQRAAEKAVEKKKIEWGSQVRSYILHPYKMVKDHRTDTQSHQPEQVLDGQLEEFIENYLVLNPEN